MKILITGGAGFIASHTAKQLLDRGDQVVLFDNFSTSAHGLNDSRAEVIEGDIRGKEQLKNALQGVEAVIHMASLISVEESVKMPLKYVENNIVGSVVLLEAMREAGVKKVVFSSSATVYGTPKEFPIKEETMLSSTNPYAATKVGMEALLESFHRTDGFDVLILRYFNPYGPGENHQPETHAIPNFIKAGLERRSIPLYWKGEQVRDFIYVEDLAKAHIAALKLNGFQVFNVGTEHGTKIIDVVNIISDILGYEGTSFGPAGQNKLEVEDKGERAGDVMATYASSKKLEEKTGWKAEIPLEEGLRKTVAWFKDKAQ